MLPAVHAEQEGAHRAGAAGPGPAAAPRALGVGDRHGVLELLEWGIVTVSLVPE